MKKIRNLVICFLASFMFVTGVDAASGSITVSTGTRVAAVGSTFTVKVRLSCSESLGSWDFGVSYDSAYVSYVGSTPLHVISQTATGTEKTKEYSYTFKAIKSGNANIRIGSAQMAGYDEMRIFTPSTNSVSVTVKTQAEIQASYSKNNNLKSLSVDGYELSPAFDKDTLEYKISVPDTETQVKVNASVQDTTARVSGTGTKELSEGINKIDIIVTAQNGSTKTYTILVDVKDLNPITVSIDGKTLSVIKKEELLTAPTGYSASPIKIGEIEVPAFKSDKTGLTVVGLKDEEGNVGLYTYDEAANKYEPYRELKSNSLTLLPKAPEDIPKDFSNTTLEINDREYEVLKSDKAQDFYLIYGMNVETGDVDYYIYDKDTSSLIRYNAKYYDSLKKETAEMRYFVYSACAVAGLLLLIAILEKARINKLKRLLKKVSLKQKEALEIEENEEVVESPSGDTEEETFKEENSSEEDSEFEDLSRKKRKHKKEKNKNGL